MGVISESSTSDWLKQISFLARHQSEYHYPDLTSNMSQHRISSLVSQTPFREETSGGVAICRLFSQAKRDPISFIEDILSMKSS